MLRARLIVRHSGTVARPGANHPKRYRSAGRSVGLSRSASARSPLPRVHHRAPLQNDATEAYTQPITRAEVDPYIRGARVRLPRARRRRVYARARGRARNGGRDQVRATPRVYTHRQIRVSFKNAQRRSLQTRSPRIGTQSLLCERDDQSAYRSRSNRVGESCVS